LKLAEFDAEESSVCVLDFVTLCWRSRPTYRTVKTHGG
jgi:hypothetical protein